MKKLRFPKGILQLMFVAAFIVGSLLISQLLKSKYQPPQRNAGGEMVIVGEAEVVSPASYRLRFTTTGIVEARTEIDIVPQVSGRVVTVAPDFDDGGTFTEDEILFQLEEDDFIFEIKRLEAEVARAQTALDIEKAEVEAAIADWKGLNGSRPIPKLVKREPQLREAEVNLEAAKAQLSNANLQLARASYRLPASGRVMESRVAAGQFLQSGASYGKVFYFEELEVVASLDDQRLNWLYAAEDPDIVVTSTHLGKTVTSEARLDRGAAILDPQTRFASVRFLLDEGAERLLPGVFVDIEVVGATYKSVTQIPLGAIQQGGHLWLVDEENRLRKHLPEILTETPDHVAVLNLPGTNRVMTLQLPGAVEGAEVRLLGENETEAL